MLTHLPAASLARLHRVLLVALVVPALWLIALALLPALAVLPFFDGGTHRAAQLIAAVGHYTRTLLTTSR